MQPNRNRCCELLGVAPSATRDQIKEAYHDLVKVWHPDRFAHDAALALKAQEKLKEINEAYSALSRMPDPGPSRTGGPGQPFSSPTPHPKVKETFWESPLLMFLVLVLGMVLLGLVMFVFQNNFQSPSTGKSLQDIV